MSARLAALVCVAAYVAALALPCPPLAPASEPDGHHAGAVAHADHAHHASSQPPLQLEASCPCGCADRGATPLSSARLGWAELSEKPEAVFASAWMPLTESEPRPFEAPVPGIDPVPI